MRPVGAAALTVNRSAIRLVARGSRFLQRRPLLAKALPTAFGFAFGDLLTQYFNRPTPGGAYTHDPRPTAAMVVAGGAVAAPIGLALYRWMDLVWPGSSWLLAAGKFTLDQLVGCFIWQVAYLTISDSYRARLQRGLHQLAVATCAHQAAAAAAAADATRSSGRLLAPACSAATA